MHVGKLWTQQLYYVGDDISVMFECRDGRRI